MIEKIKYEVIYISILVSAIGFLSFSISETVTILGFKNLSCHTSNHLPLDFVLRSFIQDNRTTWCCRWLAIDHGLASPDTADKTYRKALGKMKKELKKKDIS